MNNMIRKRQSMKRRNIKKLLEKLSKTYGDLNVNKVEKAEFEESTIYIFDDHVEFIEKTDVTFPVLNSRIIENVPSVIIDMGAIPFVCNGADLMSPGIVEIRGFFMENEIVVIRDITHEKSIAVGRALKSSEDIKKIKKGKVITNLHHVGDKLWKAII
jgi:PUA domain protein